MKKTAGVFAMIAVMFIASISVSAQMKVSIDGRELAFNQEPKMINDRVMVPVRKILEEIGAEVTYDKETSTATAIKDAHYAQFTSGSDYLLLGVCADGKNDGELSYSTSVKLDSVPVILNNTMYVPLRAVSDAFYYDVEWDAKEQTAKITTPKEADGWIYYSCWNDKGHMYKIDTNGQNRQMITDGDCYMESISFATNAFEYSDGYIYYSLREPENPQTEGVLYRIKPDGTGKEQITDKPTIFLTASTDSEKDEVYILESADGTKDKYLSLIDNSVYLKRVDLKTKETKLILDEPVQDVDIYENYIYFRYADKGIESFSFYRMDTNGENIIKVTGDIPVRYLHVYDDRLYFSDALNYNKDYTAALDGSDLQEEGKDDSYDAIKEKYNLKEFTRLQNDDSDEEETELAVIGTKEDGYTYFIKENGGEVFELKLPEDVRPYDVTATDDRLFYDVRKGKYETGKLYVDSIDEIMGMKYISVGAEKVDGKYEITGGNFGMKYIPSEEDGIYCIDFSGDTSKKILDGYYLGKIKDNKLFVSKLEDYYDYNAIMYTADLDGSNIQEYKAVSEYEAETDRPSKSADTGLKLNENAMYGIIVKNDGTVESYYNRVQPY